MVEVVNTSLIENTDILIPRTSVKRDDVERLEMKYILSCFSLLQARIHYYQLACIFQARNQHPCRHDPRD